MDGTGLAELEQHVVSRLVHRVWTSYWKRRDFFVFPSFLLRESAQDWVPPPQRVIRWMERELWWAGGWMGRVPPPPWNDFPPQQLNQPVGWLG
jgi:hypothetical protein